MIVYLHKFSLPFVELNRYRIAVNMYLRFVLALIVVARYSPATIASDRLIGYDCNNSDVNVTRIDLTGVKDCVRLSPDDVHVIDVNVQVISKRTKAKIIYYACDVVWSRIWYYCGDLHHLHGMPDHYREYRVKFTPLECKNAHLSKAISIQGVNFYDIEIGQERREQLTLAGSFGFGYCDDDSFGGSSRSTVTGHVKILFTQITDQINIDDSTISIEQVAECDNDITKYCLHPFRGFIGWDYDIYAECTPRSWNVIYEGPAQVVSYNTKFQKNQYLTINRGHSVGAIRLKEMSSACSVVTQKTEHADLQVVFQSGSVPFYFQKYRILEKDVSIANYMNTKFLYLEQHIGTSLDELRIELIYTMCQNLKKIYDNRLLIAASDPDQFARLEFGLGYSGVVMGEVIYILKCTPEVVYLRSTDVCYQDVPVYYNNQSKFISARNRIIQNVSEEVECSKRLSPSYNIVGDWVSLSPEVGYSDIPIRLDPNGISFNWTYRRLWNFGIAGLYEEELIKSLENIMVQGATKVSILSYLVRKVNNLPTGANDYNIVNAIDMNVVKERVVGVVSGVWSFLEEGGSLFSIFLFMAFIVTSVIKIISIFGNVVNLYKTFGFSYRLFAAISTGLVGLILRRNDSASERNVRNDVPLERVLTSHNLSQATAPHSQDENSVPLLHSVLPFRPIDYNVGAHENRSIQYPHRALLSLDNGRTPTIGGTSTASGRREP